MVKNASGKESRPRTIPTDPDLALPWHDAIMQWTVDNLDKVVRQVVVRSGQCGLVSEADMNRTRWDGEVIQRLRNDANEFLAEEISATKERLKIESDKNVVHTLHEILDELEAWQGLGDPPAFLPFLVKKVVWQRPLTDSLRSTKILGYIDLVATIQDVFLDAGVPSHLLRVLRPDNYFPPFLPSLPAWALKGRSVATLYIEAVTNVRAVGELLRQINFYRLHIGESCHFQEGARGFVVVSPDDRFRDVIESQDVTFVHCPIQSV